MRSGRILGAEFGMSYMNEYILIALDHRDMNTLVIRAMQLSIVRTIHTIQQQ
jgi:hypothetical protein